MDQKKILENEMKEVKADVKDIQTEIDRTTFKLTHEELDEKDKKYIAQKLKSLNKELKSLSKHLSDLVKEYNNL